MHVCITIITGYYIFIDEYLCFHLKNIYLYNDNYILFRYQLKTLGDAFFPKEKKCYVWSIFQDVIKCI